MNPTLPHTRLFALTLAAAALTLLPALPLTVSAQAQSAPTQPDRTTLLDWQHETPTTAEHGMVVSVHHLASDAGVEILMAGGNAVDAAVATGFALAVVHPPAGNIGGGGFLLLRLRDGFSTFIDYREQAPLAATADMYVGPDGKVYGEEDLRGSVTGYRSIGTPGAVAGLAYAEQKYGRLGLKAVMAPAIRLASEGFVLTAEEAREMHDPDLARFAASRRIFQRDGNYYAAGERFRQPELARTLTRIAANPDDFYHGALARELAAEIKQGGGLVTTADLAAYRVKERTPVTGSFDGLTVISAPLPSSGGIVMLEALNILDSAKSNSTKSDAAKPDAMKLSAMGDRSSAWIHSATEAYRRAFMDRSEYMGDPDYNVMPVREMLSPEYAAAWRSSITDRATPSAELKRPAGFLPPPPATAGLRRESQNTTHYSVVDSEGNAVSVTTTLNNGYGSHVTAGSLGFLLNDEMDDFTSKVGVANMFGLMQGPANAIAPLKRPLSAMTPTIVLKDGRLRWVLGSPGGPRIITTVANILLSAAEGGLNIQQAVDAPRFHHQYLPDTLYLEPGFAPETIESLKAMGYRVSVRDGHWSNGECIAVDPKTGLLEGGQDHRSHYGKAAGY